MTTIGIDPSLTSTAVVAIRGECVRSEVFGSKPANGLKPRMLRFSTLIESVLGVVREYLDPVVFIEAYSYASKGGLQMDRIEYGGLLRYGLLTHGEVEVYEVPPASLKKFASGKGTADKTAMALAVYKRWGVQFDTSDEVDAYALARFGEVYLGLTEPATDAQRAAVEAVKNPKTKTKKRGATL